MTVGEQIEELVKVQGTNLRQLAIRANVPYNTVYAIVRRNSDRIQWETLERIAAALGTTPAILKGEIDTMKIAEKAESPRQQKIIARKILSQEEVEQQILNAEQAHKDYLEKLCFDPTMPDEDYPARIRYVTSFIEKNADTLKLAMPGTSMAPDDIEEAKKIRATGGTPDSSK